jgi:hypothetical protein
LVSTQGAILAMTADRAPQARLAAHNWATRRAEGAAFGQCFGARCGSVADRPSSSIRTLVVRRLAVRHLLFQTRRRGVHWKDKTSEAPHAHQARNIHSRQFVGLGNNPCSVSQLLTFFLPKNSTDSPVRTAGTVDSAQRLQLPSIDVSGGIAIKGLSPRDHDLQEPVKLSFPRR